MVKSNVGLYAAILVVVVIIIVAAVFLFKGGTSTPALVVNPIRSIQVTINNAQSSATPSQFQQMVTFNPASYAQYESSDLGNIRFYQGSTELYSWCESGCKSSSSQAVFWVKLPGSISASSSTSINMTFKPVGTEYDNNYAGEAPEQSAAYAQYDNGANVFEYYSNFAGPSMPIGWTSQPNGGTITVSNGAYLVGGRMRLISDWPVSAGVVEMYLTSENTNNGDDWILTSGNNTQNYNYFACGVGYQNQRAGGGTQGGYGLNIQNDSGGTPSIVASASPSPTFPAVIGVYGANLYADYAVVSSVASGCTLQNTIFGSTYLQMAAETGVGTANFAFDWVRIRAPPPDGVMPSATVG